MNICGSGHTEIVYTDLDCPLCWVIRELNRAELRASRFETELALVEQERERERWAVQHTK